MMKQLLVPVDMSDTAANALRFAHALAARTHAELTVLHAYPLKVQGRFLSLQEIEQREREAAAEARQRLQAFVVQALGEGAKVHQVVRMGFPIEEIIALTDARPYDIVVMGSKGATNLADRFLGTNTINIIRNVQVPVLVVPQGARNAHFQTVVLMADGQCGRESIEKLGAWCGQWNVQLQVYTEGNGPAAEAIQHLKQGGKATVVPDQGRAYSEALHDIYRDHPQLLALNISESHLDDVFAILQRLSSSDDVPVLTLP